MVCVLVNCGSWSAPRFWNPFAFVLTNFTHANLTHANFSNDRGDTLPRKRSPNRLPNMKHDVLPALLCRERLSVRTARDTQTHVT